MCVKTAKSIAYPMRARRFGKAWARRAWTFCRVRHAMFPRTQMQKSVLHSTVCRVGLDVGLISSGTNSYPINAVSGLLPNPVEWMLASSGNTTALRRNIYKWKLITHLLYAASAHYQLISQTWQEEMLGACSYDVRVRASKEKGIFF